MPRPIRRRIAIARSFAERIAVQARGLERAVVEDADRHAILHYAGGGYLRPILKLSSANCACSRFGNMLC
jgi:hypothetical protein